MRFAGPACGRTLPAERGFRRIDDLLDCFQLETTTTAAQQVVLVQVSGRCSPDAQFERIYGTRYT